MARELAEFKALLSEMIYVSSHPKNKGKRYEVAILILLTFTEDISHYMTRNPDYATLMKVFEQLHAEPIKPLTTSLRTLLTGRTL
jgi:hypothetical protein